MANKLLSEHDIQSQILGWLQHRKIFHWRNNTGAMAGKHKGRGWFVRFGVRGSPDIFAVIDGQIFGIEVKAKGGVLSEQQLVWAERFMACGGRYVTAYCLEDVKQVVEQRDEEEATRSK